MTYQRPPLPVGHTIGCGHFNGQKLLTKAEAREYAERVLGEFCDECLDVVARHGGSVEIEAAIRGLLGTGTRPQSTSKATCRAPRSTATRQPATRPRRAARKCCC
jgi:hypothetical protein